MPGVGRRSVLLGAAGALTLALTGCGAAEPSVPYAQGSFVSRRRGDVRTGWTVLYPPGHEHTRLPVLVVLHGRSGNNRSAYQDLHLDHYLARTVSAGTRPFAVASVDGGDHDYWHPRRSGDPAGMVVDEFVPLLSGRGLEVGRIGLLGWSMGGYGALYLAGVLRATRCAVAVAESPAIWHRSDQTAAGAFDGPADFAAHTIFGRQALLKGIALRVDCGAADGFAPVTRDVRASIPPHAGGRHRAGWARRVVLALAGTGPARLRRRPPGLSRRRATRRRRPRGSRR